MKHEAFHSPRARRQRINDPEGTRRNIVEIATAEFADKGFSGARVDDIAARTKTSKRMIYYYFGGKEGLYIAVLEAAYRSIRSIEAALDLEHQQPEQALRALIAFTFDYQNAHPEFVRLVMNENILNGAYLARSKEIQRLNATVIDALRDLISAGPTGGCLPARRRSGRSAYVDQCIVLLQCCEPRHVLHDLQARHGIAARVDRSPRPGH